LAETKFQWVVVVVELVSEAGGELQKTAARPFVELQRNVLVELPVVVQHSLGPIYVELEQCDHLYGD